MGIINMGTANFKTFDETGKELLNANLATYCFVKSGKLTRLISHTFESTYRVIGKKARTANTGHENVYGYIHTPHYCVYYIDLPLDSISPIPFIYYTGSATDADTVPSLVYLSTGKVGNNTRLFFYSNGRLSDTELNSFNIYIFDIKPLKEDKVGLNLYNQQGQLTFSSKTYPLNIAKVITTNDARENQQYNVGNIKAGVYSIPAPAYTIFEFNDSFNRDLRYYSDTNNLKTLKYMYLTSVNTQVKTKATVSYNDIHKDSSVKSTHNLETTAKDSNGVDIDNLFHLIWLIEDSYGYDNFDDRSFQRVINSEKYLKVYLPRIKDVFSTHGNHLKGLVIDVTHLPFPFN